MKSKTIALVFLSLGFSVGSSAQDDTAPLKLKDGRVLSDWVVKQETPTAVIVRHSEGLSKVYKNLLPEDLRNEYPIDDAAATAEAREQAQEQEERAHRAAEERKVQAETRHARLVEDQQETSKRNALTLAEERLIQAAMQERAERFFRYEFAAGSGYAYVSDTSIELTEIEPKPGWPGEYSVRGKGWIQYYDSVPHGHFRRDSREFTAEVKIDPHHPRGAEVTHFMQR
jgi:hypothetical protein